MAEHSPLPWRVIKAFEDEPARIIDADDDEVAVELIDADAALIVEAVNERDRLRDTIRSYGETIVQLNEAAQKSELKAIRLRELARRLCDELESHYYEPESMNDPCIIREAREETGKEEP